MVVYILASTRNPIPASIVKSGALATHQLARNMNEFIQELHHIHASIVKRALNNHQDGSDMNELMHE